MKRAPKQGYRQERIVEAELGGQRIRLVTRPGFPSWGHISQAVHLIAAHVPLTDGERVLVCPCGHGALALWAATRTEARHVTALDTNVVAVEVARRTLAANGYPDVRVEVALPACETLYGTALIELPKGRDLARLLFLYTLGALREGGHLYLAGANDEGIKSAIHDAEALFGASTVLAYKGGNRVVAFSRGPAPASPLPTAYSTPGLAVGSYHEFTAEVRGEVYPLRTRPGVFSWRALDAGTRLLLEVLDVHTTDNVLDVGCGYGIIGMFAARRALKGQVTLVDVDLLACESARASLALNGLAGVEVLLGDGLAAVAGRRFSLIVSNPPFHTGHAVSSEVAEAFVSEAYEALEPRGRLVLVANRFLPYQHWMTELFGAVTPLAETPQYHVLSAEKAFRRKARGKPSRASRRVEDIEIVDESDDDW